MECPLVFRSEWFRRSLSRLGALCLGGWGDSPKFRPTRPVDVTSTAGLWLAAKVARALSTARCLLLQTVTLCPSFTFWVVNLNCAVLLIFSFCYPMFVIWGKNNTGVAGRARFLFRQSFRRLPNASPELIRSVGASWTWGVCTIYVRVECSVGHSVSWLSVGRPQTS
jgi:hypothetical protein